MNQYFTVIIPVGCSLSRLGYIRPIIEWYRQTNPDFNIEFIITEYGPETQYREIAELCQVKYIYMEQNDQFFNKAKALNFAFMRVTTKYCIINDADMLPPDDYLNKLLEIFKDYEASYNLSFYYSSIELQNWVEIDGKMILNRSIKDLKGRNARHNAPGGIVAIVSQDIIKIGGMNEAFFGYGYEDTDFYLRCERKLKTTIEKLYQAIHMRHISDPGKSRYGINQRLFKRSRYRNVDEYIKELKQNLIKYKL